MDGNAVVGQALGEIYDSAVDQGAWDRLPAVLARLVGAQSSSLHVESDGAVEAMAGWNQEAAIPHYLAYFHLRDPWRAKALRRPVLRGIGGEELVRPEELLETEFYNDYARHHGVFHVIGTFGALAPGIHFQAVVHRPREAPGFNPVERARFDGVLPHLQRALQLRRRLQLAEARAETGFAALSVLSFAALICDDRGFVRFANEAAERLARVRTGLSLGNRASPIAASTPTATRELRRLVRDAASGGPGGAMRIEDDQGGAIFALVAPLARALRDRPGRDRLALVAISGAGEAPGFGPAVLSSLFGLTAAETGLALSLLTSRSLEEIAADRGVSMATVRTQLRGVFAKTGTENQRDLVCLLGRIPQLR